MAVRYFTIMSRFVILSTVIIACLGSSATIAAAAGRDPDRFVLGASPAQRLGGTAATAFVTARIVRASASVGRDYGPPAPRMKPRQTSVTAADGRTVATVVYDFE